MDTSKIQEHMPVVGSDGQHIGTVDHVQGQSIKLTKSDSADGHHHYLPLSAVAGVDDSVRLAVSAADAQAQLQTTAPSENEISDPQAIDARVQSGAEERSAQAAFGGNQNTGNQNQ